MRESGGPCGFLNLDKPTGMTSRDVVNLVGRVLRQTRLGHGGTLDPLASGVLVVGVGPSTRLIEFVQRQAKVYRAVIRLGARSDTLDADGRIVETPDPTIPTEAQVLTALAAQVGTIAQVPPQFSALKVGGRRAYDLARSGREVALAPRRVVIHRIDLISFAWPLLEIEVGCGIGTYIRSIARDVGEGLGCGGLILALTRTRIGPFLLSDAIDPRTLTTADLAGGLRPASLAVSSLPAVTLTSEQVAMIAQGKPLDPRLIGPTPPPSGELALLGPDGVLVAVGEHDSRQRVWPRRVLVGG